MVIKLGLQLTSSQLYNRTLAICFSKYESTRFPTLLWPDFIILIHFMISSRRSLSVKSK